MALIFLIKTFTVDKDKKDQKPEEQTSDGLQPDPSTLHKTDPQENMEGPNSSVMQKIKEIAEKNDEVSKEEATKRRDRKM